MFFAMQMEGFLSRLFGPKKKKVTRKDSVTGRNKSLPVPYLSRLEGNQLQPGQSLVVRGYITAYGTNVGISCATEWIVNITSGPCVEKEEEDDMLDDRLLSIRVDMARKKVLLNACIGGEWGREGAVKQAYREGDEFDFRIRCCEDAFDIYIEHKLVARFKYYVPMSKATHIYVNGDVQLYTVSWEGKFYQVPYTAEIPGPGLSEGRKLFLSFVAGRKAKQFTLDLLSANDIALRVNPSFFENKLLRNSRIQGKWGHEERDLDGRFPFKRKRAFDMLLFCEENRFMIFINDIFYAAFDHRIPPSLIDRLTIDGDLELLGVHLK